MKLQKLLYYSYAWYLVDTRNERRLFNDDIEAWKYGPVVRSVYDVFKNRGADSIKHPYVLGTHDENYGLDLAQQEVVEDVYKSYGMKNAIELMEMTHNEEPWIKTYQEGKNNVIDPQIIYQFYSQLSQSV
ncbi:DUF4065 domain-containing protein [bacterium]|nr:DUF4065 domain-containing protein [bacterium]